MNSNLRIPVANLDFPERPQLRSHLDEVQTSFQRLLPVLGSKLELLDRLDIGDGKNESLLFQIISGIQDLKSEYLAQKWKHCDQNAVLAKLQEQRVAEVAGEVLFSTCGSRKTNIRDPGVRRMSFAATKFIDNDKLLRLTDLSAMSDLDYLFYMNAYYLPYCGRAEGRSMYETLISTLINHLAANVQSDKSDEEAELFRVLHEIIPPIHIVTEFTVSVIECILEMLVLVNVRIKTAELTIDQKLELSEIQNAALEHYLACFNSPEKIYAHFRKRKLLAAIPESDQLRGSVNWTSRLSEYHETLLDALDLYELNCRTFGGALANLKLEVSEFRQSRPHQQDSGNGDRLTMVEELLAKVLVLISELESLLKFVRGRDYQEFYEAASALLETLGELQEKYPLRYGGLVTPRTLRGRKTSASASPRSSDGEGSRSNSPRIDSPRQHQRNLSLSNSGGGLLSRVVGSVFRK